MRIKILTRKDVIKVGGDKPLDFVPIIENAFLTHAQKQSCLPIKPYLRIPHDHESRRIIAMPAYLGGDIQTWGLKWIASAPLNPTIRNSERASGLVILNDLASGAPVCILEGALLSAVRTVSIAICAVKYLAKNDFKDVSIIGNGLIGELFARTIVSRYKHIERLHLYDKVPQKSEELQTKLSEIFPGQIISCKRAETALRPTDICFLATTATEGYIDSSWISPGALVLNISLRDPMFNVIQEFDKVVVDDWEQCNRGNTVIHKMTQKGLLSFEDIHCELPSILMGQHPGRENQEERIIFNPMGLAIADIAVAHEIFLRSQAQEVGHFTDFI